MSNDHVDSAVLSSLRDVMEGEYPVLLDVFIKDSEKRIDDLRQFLAAPGALPGSAEQWQQLGMLAHSFKGSSANMGAGPLSDLCRQLEDLARTAVPNASQAAVLIRAIDDEYQLVQVVFDAELRRSLTRH